MGVIGLSVGAELPSLVIGLALGQFFGLHLGMIFLEILLFWTAVELETPVVALLASVATFLVCIGKNFSMAISYFAVGTFLFLPYLLLGSAPGFLGAFFLVQLLSTFLTYAILTTFRMCFQEALFLGLLNKFAILLLVLVFCSRISPTICAFGSLLLLGLIPIVDSRGSILLISVSTISAGLNLVLDFGDLVAMLAANYAVFLGVNLVALAGWNLVSIVGIVFAIGLPISVGGLAKLVSVGLSDQLSTIQIFVTYTLAIFLLVKIVRPTENSMGAG